VLKRLRSIYALPAADADAEESVEKMDTPSESVRDAGESASADSDLIDVDNGSSHLLTKVAWKRPPSEWG
jgi:hypothetical protein